MAASQSPRTTFSVVDGTLVAATEGGMSSVAKQRRERWWRRDDREEALERELQSRLDVEMSDQKEQGLPAEEPATPPGAPSAIRL